MNIAPPEISAPPVRAAAGTPALLRGLVLGALLAGACGMGMAAGVADRGDQREMRDGRDYRDNRDNRDPREQRERAQPQQQLATPQVAPRELPPQRGEVRAYEARGDDVRRQQQQQLQQQLQQQTLQVPQDGGRRGGRLTPDERRELRRQINEAGMDLYPNAPRR